MTQPFLLGEDNFKEVGYDGECYDCWLEFADSIMQYTGLKDKNGVEIYEGDVVTIHHEDSPSFNAKVFYHKRWGAFEIAGTGNTFGWHTDLRGCAEVIGNIHENPELI